MSESMISVWITAGELQDYMRGVAAEAWDVRGEYQRINLLIPLDHVKSVEEHENQYSKPVEVEFLIQKPKEEQK